MADLVYEVGYPNVTLAELLSRAHVAKRVFYRLFSGKEALFASAYETAARNAITVVETASSGSRTRAEIVGRGVDAFLDAVGRRPADAYLGLLETIAVGPAATGSMRATEAEFVEMVVRRFAAADDPVVVPPRIAHGLVAGVGRLAREQLKGRADLGPTDVEDLKNWALSVSDPAVTTLATSPDMPGGARGSRSRFAGDLRLPMSEKRALLIRAVIALAAEEGYEGLSPRRIAETAGLSKRTFEDEFEGVEDCVSRALEAGTVVIVADVRAAFNAAPDWSHGMCRMLEALCEFLSSEPGLARLAFVELFVPGRAVTRRGSEILSAVAKLLRDRTPFALRTGPATAEASIGAIWALLREEVAGGRIAGISRLAPTLAWIVLAPTIGGAQASEVLGDPRALGGDG
jgi:AcrR family transcriptional regulator